jgi:nucleoside transporter
MSEPAAAPPGVLPRLSAMMFLQYAIWGAWLPLLWPFLSEHRGLSGPTIGNLFAVGAVGAIVAPFIAGQVADRYFATERYLAVSHLLGAVLVWQLASVETSGEFLVYSLAYSLIYSPTLSLTNSLAFHHLPDRDRDFGRVRLWGTVGWIAVGIGIGQWLASVHTPSAGTAEAIRAAQVAGMGDAFRLSAILGAVMGLYCLSLPHTPPARGAERNATFEALGEVRRQPLLVLFLLAVPVSCIHQFYFVHTSGFLGRFQAQAEGAVSAINSIFGVGGGGLMTIGQMSEIAVLALIPAVAKSVSRKSLLGLGLCAYALRMALFGYAEALPEALRVPAVLFGVALHGLCFGCFIFVAFMVVDEETSAQVRASAQSLFNLVIVGIGIIVGSMVAGEAAEWATVDGVLDYRRLFALPMWASLACLLGLLLFYRRGPHDPSRALRGAA